MWDNHQDAICRTLGLMFLLKFKRLRPSAQEAIRRAWEVPGGLTVEEMLESSAASPPEVLLIAIRNAADDDGLYHLVS